MKSTIHFKGRSLIQRLMVAAIPSAMVAGGMIASAQEKEWWENNPYYEEDNWLDVTEWFDGNNYHRTDEASFRQDDETGDAADGTGLTTGNDWDYDYTDTRDYYQGGFHSNARTYGHDRRATRDDWFYDYWDDGYASYHDWDGDGAYEELTNWYDHNGDGFYDSSTTYHDWDGNGTYEDVEFTSYVGSSEAEKERSSADAPKPAGSRQQQFSGTVERSKTVSVKDAKHLVVELKKDGKTCLADLGPAKKLERFDLGEGSRIQASGPVMKVGDKNVLVAQKVTVDGKTTRIDRERRELRGQVADTRRVSTRNGEHLIAILATGKDRKTLVDLGPADRLKADLQQDDRIEVKGTPAKVNDRRVLVASELQHEGQTFTIARGKQQSQSQRSPQGQSGRGQEKEQEHSATAQHGGQDSGTMSSGSDRESSRSGWEDVSGKVESTRTMTVRGAERQTATVRTSEGDMKILVDLGKADREQASQVKAGDRLKASGTLLRTKDGKPVLLAKEARVNGERIELPSAAQPRKPLSGKVTSTRSASIGGETRLLARVETEDGQTVIVDLGQAAVFEEKPEQGDEVTAHGIAVKGSPDGPVIFVAREVECNGNEMVKIQRN